MATEEKTGTNKLVQRILDDAQSDAGKLTEEAENSVAEIRAKGEKACAERKAEYDAKLASAVKGVLDGSKTRAALDARKATLTKKRAVIDQAFAGAYQALLALSAEARGKICKNLLLREAEGGETVVPAKADRAAIAALTAEFAARKLTLSNEDADLDGGFLLLSKAYEKDCSFLSLFEELRNMEETRVAALLFSTEGGQS